MCNIFILLFTSIIQKQFSVSPVTRIPRKAELTSGWRVSGGRFAGQWRTGQQQRKWRVEALATWTDCPSPDSALVRPTRHCTCGCTSWGAWATNTHCWSAPLTVLTPRQQQTNRHVAVGTHSLLGVTVLFLVCMCYFTGPKVLAS